MNDDKELMVIFRDGRGYSIEHFGVYGARIRRMFGSTILPAAYTSSTRARAVQEAIQRLNPSRNVCLHPDLLDEEASACS